MRISASLPRVLASCVLGVAALVLAGCASVPPPRSATRMAASQAEPVQTYFAPTRGQTAAQQDRDRYECYSWAVRQSGFDPSRRPLPDTERGRIVPEPAPQADAAAPSVTATASGATASTGGSGASTMIGAPTGAVVRTGADVTRASEAGGRGYGGSDGYRRAISACLEGRGYSVK